MLELVILDDSCVPRDETQDKALNEIEKWVLQAGRLSPISALERNGRVIRGEICWRLARRKSRGHPSQLRLIEKGTKNALDAMKTMKRDGQYAYMMKTAYVVSAIYDLMANAGTHRYQQSPPDYSHKNLLRQNVPTII